MAKTGHKTDTLPIHILAELHTFSLHFICTLLPWVCKPGPITTISSSGYSRRVPSSSMTMYRLHRPPHSLFSDFSAWITPGMSCPSPAGLGAQTRLPRIDLFAERRACIARFLPPLHPFDWFYCKELYAKIQLQK